jgi:hypothetical protein
VRYDVCRYAVCTASSRTPNELARVNASSSQHQHRKWPNLIVNNTINPSNRDLRNIIFHIDTIKNPINTFSINIIKSKIFHHQGYTKPTHTERRCLVYIHLKHVQYTREPTVYPHFHTVYTYKQSRKQRDVWLSAHLFVSFATDDDANVRRRRRRRCERR